MTKFWNRNISSESPADQLTLKHISKTQDPWKFRFPGHMASRDFRHPGKVSFLLEVLRRLKMTRRRDRCFPATEPLTFPGDPPSRDGGKGLNEGRKGEGSLLTPEPSVGGDRSTGCRWQLISDTHASFSEAQTARERLVLGSTKYYYFVTFFKIIIIINRSTGILPFQCTKVTDCVAGMQDIWKFRVADAKMFCDDIILLIEVEQVV